ncbi:MAG: polysaccharide biosynthesis/export family protein [Bacteroidota bacterium]
MFKPSEEFVGKKSTEADGVVKNYVIQVNDYVKLEVYSNKGERIIDPEGALLNDKNMAAQNQVRVQPTYLVTVDGTVKFPMIGSVALLGLTIREAEQKLQAEYDNYYKQCYVQLTFSNKRVIVLGSPGGQVVPLLNENVSLVEVIAMAKGIGLDGKSHNIRVIRGQDVFLIDLSTIDGITAGNMIVQPGDIIYVEPTRRPFTEGARDLAPVFSLVLSLSTLIVVFIANNN